MNPLQTTNTNLLICIITISALSISTGCKLGFPSNKASMTKLQPKNFKFWETEDKLSASENDKTPPPPARHFSPSPLDSVQEDIVMDLKSPSAEMTQPNNSINDLRREVTAVSENPRTPIRKPYQLPDSSLSQTTNPNKSPKGFANRDLPKIQGSGFAGQFQNKNNDFVSTQNQPKNSAVSDSGFKAPNLKAPPTTTKPNLLTYGESLNKNPMFQFDNEKSKSTPPVAESSSPEASQLRSELSLAQQQLKALQNKNSPSNPIKPNLPQNQFTASPNPRPRSQNQPFVNPTNPQLTPKPKYPSTDFDSFAQKPLNSQTPLAPKALSKSLGANGTSSPPQAFKLPQAQPIPPAIDSLNGKPNVQTTSNEVDLPPSILFGKSSYAPGSTKKLLPK